MEVSQQVSLSVEIPPVDVGVLQGFGYSIHDIQPNNLINAFNDVAAENVHSQHDDQFNIQTTALYTAYSILSQSIREIDASYDIKYYHIDLVNKIILSLVSDLEDVILHIPTQNEFEPHFDELKTFASERGDQILMDEVNIYYKIFNNFVTMLTNGGEIYLTPEYLTKYWYAVLM